MKLKKIHIEKVKKKLEGSCICGENSIGQGNHFVEMTQIDKLYQDIELDKNHLYLLIHSGSRQIGEAIYQKYRGYQNLQVGTKKFDDYLLGHQHAVEFAYTNRKQLANIFMNLLKMKYYNHLIIDCVHNILEIIDNHYYHHKGSISTLINQYAIITGSRGSYSYLVKC